MHIVKLKMTAAVFLSASVLLLSSCKDNQALAEFDGGSITRKELRYVFGGKEDVKDVTVQIQDQALKGLSIMEMAALEAKKEGMDKTDAFKKALFMFDEKILLQAYNYKLTQDIETGIYDMMKMQFLVLRSPAKDPSRSARLQEAKTLLTQLNDSTLSDRDIEDLISKKTENNRYKYLGGYMDPHCISCAQNPLDFLTAPLIAAKDKKFHIIEDENGIWIIRNTGIDKIPGNELKYSFEEYLKKISAIAKRYSDAMPEKSTESESLKQFVLSKDQIIKQSEAQAQAQVRREGNQPLLRKVESLKAKLNFTIYDAANPSKAYETKKPQPQEILYSFKGKNFTYGDLINVIKDVGEENVNQQLNFLRFILIPMEVLKDENDFKKIKNSDIYEFLYSLKYNEILATMYMNKQTEKIALKPEELKQWYDLRKFNEYKGKSFLQVKDQIEKELMNMKLQQSNGQIQEELSKKYNLKIHHERLTPGRI